MWINGNGTSQTRQEPETPAHGEGFYSSRHSESDWRHLPVFEQYREWQG